ncbi:hypothetical protein Ddye_010525 [Dipteronia dyeriana]|uniref:Uncharacterized protein n=1 Tax=Dipteronia dyeriana TaxID=168575 RepID=A0AAD9XED8_9ROSI|nr:hypothetical protein Ddye_010525 [Dipteronia dyeriana]
MTTVGCCGLCSTDLVTFVEHVIREQNVLAANDFIELFCELIVAKLSIIAKRRECPADLKEGIASVIFVAPRCSKIPELVAMRDIFEKKYGKDFVSAATDLRPSSGVNRLLIEKLSVRTPTEQIGRNMYVEYKTSTAEAAAESAKNAIAAAQAAVYLARRDSNQFMQPSSFDEIYDLKFLYWTF